MEVFNDMADELSSFGLGTTVDPATKTPTLLAKNMEIAIQQDCRHEFRPAMQAVCKKYAYNHKHGDASLNDILTEMAAADSLHILCEGST